MLTLFKFLTRYDHEYILYYDQSHQFYGDQTFEESLLNVQSWIDYLTKEGVDYIILPPVYELALLGWNVETLKGWKVLPLFKEYVMKECFAYSHVGKIGAMGDYADVEVIQKYLKMLEKTYTLSETQKAIKKFHSPFSYWTKEVPLWKYFLAKLSFSSMMVNRIVKEDLKYFKDAMVDTLIPLNYGYFNYQHTISKFLNFKKIRFHKLEKVEAIFQWITQHLKLKTSNYTVKVCYTWHIDFLVREKKWLRLLQRGAWIRVEMLRVELATASVESWKSKKVSKVKK